MFKETVECQGDCLVLRLEGKPNLTDIARMRRTFWEGLTEKGVKRIVVDASGATALTSAAVSLLVAAKNLVSRMQAELVLTGIHGESRQFLERTHLVGFFDIRANLSDALATPPQAPDPAESAAECAALKLTDP